MALNISLAAKDAPEIAPDFYDTQSQIQSQIKVIGVGGAGGNAVDSMMRAKVEGVEFVVCNTDQQSLEKNLPERKIQLGYNLTKGHGTGAKPEMGARAAKETVNEIRDMLADTKLLFLTAGMGGGTGTGAAPVIAQCAREMGILTAAVVTQPFHFEGERRLRAAARGIKELSRYVDILVVINNQKLFQIADETTTLQDAFRMTDEVLASGIRGITDLITLPGVINLDFSDVFTVMNEKGRALIGTGEEEGEGRAIRAAEKALSNHLLDDLNISNAKSFLINVVGGSDLGLLEVDKAVSLIRAAAPQSAQLIFGASTHESMENKIRITILATGIEPPEMAESTAQDSQDSYNDVWRDDMQDAQVQAQEPREMSHENIKIRVKNNDESNPAPAPVAASQDDVEQGEVATPAPPPPAPTPVQEIPPIHEMVSDDENYTDITHDKVVNINQSIAGKQVEDINLRHEHEMQHVPSYLHANGQMNGHANIGNDMQQKLSNINKIDIAGAEHKLEELRSQIHFARAAQQQLQQSEPQPDTANQIAELQNQIREIQQNYRELDTLDENEEAMRLVNNALAEEENDIHRFDNDYEHDDENERRDYQHHAMAGRGERSIDARHESPTISQSYPEHSVPNDEGRGQKKSKLSLRNIKNRRKQEFSNQMQSDIFSLPFDDNVSEAQIHAEAKAGGELLKERKELDIPAFLRRQNN